MKLAWLVLIGLAFGSAGVVEAQQLQINRKEPEKAIFDSRVDSCDSSDLPDAPARAFRGRAGQIVMFVPNFRARAFEGSGLLHLTKDCRTRFLAAGSADADRLDDRTWLHAFTTLPSGDIFAFGSAGYLPYRHGQKCRVGEGRTACWYNGIVALRSNDGGRVFRYMGEPPTHLVFPPPAPYRDDIRNPAGFITITNIVRHGGYRYAMVWYRDKTLSNSRNCLMRATGDDVSHWSIKTAEGFREVASFVAGRWQTAPADCEGIGQGILGSVRAIAFHPETQMFVSIFVRAPREKPELNGVYYSFSRDLLHWNEALLLYKAPHVTGENLENLDSDGTELIAYPSLIDERSSDPDFGTITFAPSLIVTKIGRDKDDRSKRRSYRKIVVIPLTLTPP